MGLIVPNASQERFLSYLLKITTVDTPILRLFNNNVTPGVSTSLSNLTQVTAAGYSPITLAPGTWSVSTDGSNKSTASYPTQTFTFTATDTIYGYYVTNQANTVVLWLQRASFAPSILPASGGIFTVTPELSFKLTSS